MSFQGISIAFQNKKCSGDQKLLKCFLKVPQISENVLKELREIGHRNIPSFCEEISYG
jgi:hypothetical protein